LTPKPEPPKQIPNIFNSIRFNVENKTRDSYHINSRRGQNVERMVEMVKLSVHETIDKSKKKGPALEEFLNPVPSHRYSAGLPLHMDVDRACQGVCLTISRQAGPGRIGRCQMGAQISNQTRSCQVEPLGPESVQCRCSPVDPRASIRSALRICDISDLVPALTTPFP
jgi:hypothetical protein